jgi:membrane protease YdiL (CAAX protease family)
MTRAIGRRELMRLLFLTEAALLVLAVLVAWLHRGTPWPFALSLSLDAFLWGIAAALPPLLVVSVLYLPWTARIAPLHRAAEAILDRLAQVLRTPLLTLGVGDIVLLSLAAGIGEELFFRGALQPWLGWWAASLIFGVLHALTPLYFLLATAIGLYLGWLYDYTGNLLLPVLAHAAYDVAALYLLQGLLRRRGGNISES